MPTSKKKRKDGKSYSMGASKPHELKLPSVDEEGEHNVCLVRRPGPQGLVKMGILDSLDTLTQLVAAKIGDIETGGSSAPDPEAIRALSQNAKGLENALDLIDRIVVGVVVEPKVHPIPVEDPKTGEIPEREDSCLYIDDVDLEDRMFIMNFAVGGSADWESFRSESAANVARVEASPVLLNNAS